MKEDVGQPSRRRLTEGMCGSTESPTFDLREGVGQPSQRRSMREGVGQPSRRRLTDTEKVLERDNFFLQRLQSAHSISKSTKEVCSVEGAWFSVSILPTMVHSKAICIIARHHPIERASPSPLCLTL